VKPPSGEFQSVEDLAGSLIAGTADDLREGVERYRELGADVLVLDLRFRFADWTEQIEALADALKLRADAHAA
jgi:alkanesulfonate monooxygenase SsuD/methylene tetrahydromethanopterin reductase-like flavin-dependent oxidoreductase (luciferase family)